MGDPNTCKATRKIRANWGGKMTKTIKLSDDIQIRKTTAGDWLNLREVIPPETTAIILFRNDGTGLKPIGLLLPHQVVLQDLQNILGMYYTTKEFSILPVDTKNLVIIAEVK